MLSRADSSKFSLPRTPFIPELQWKLVVTLLTSDILGISSLRGVSWKWRQQGGGGRAMSSKISGSSTVFFSLSSIFPHPLFISNSI